MIPDYSRVTKSSQNVTICYKIEDHINFMDMMTLRSTLKWHTLMIQRVILMRCSTPKAMLSPIELVVSNFRRFLIIEIATDGNDRRK